MANLHDPNGVIVVTPVQLKNLIRQAVKECLPEVAQVAHEFPVKSKADDLITRKRACEILGVSLPTLAEFRKQGKLKAYRMGRRVYLKESEVLEALEANKSA